MIGTRLRRPDNIINTEPDMNEFYRNMLPVLDRRMAGERKRFDWIINRIPEGATVIDLGCGYPVWNGQIQGKGIIYTGVDFSRQIIDYLKVVIPQHSWIQQDIFQYQGHAQVVIGAEIIEHLVCPLSFLFLADSLATNKILITTPIELNSYSPRHLWSFRAKELLALGNLFGKATVEPIELVEHGPDRFYGLEIIR